MPDVDRNPSRPDTPRSTRSARPPSRTALRARRLRRAVWIGAAALVLGLAITALPDPPPEDPRSVVIPVEGLH